mmetsp:Transcript_353/g.1374  ORF Transcript_353/g.1374 Transcript_353/m.1374 type:complete len:234 (-) Transcript_353:2696-3397(-)
MVWHRQRLTGAGTPPPSRCLRSNARREGRCWSHRPRRRRSESRECIRRLCAACPQSLVGTPDGGSGCFRSESRRGSGTSSCRGSPTARGSGPGHRRRSGEGQGRGSGFRECRSATGFGAPAWQTAPGARLRRAPPPLRPRQVGASRAAERGPRRGVRARARALARGRAIQRTSSLLRRRVGHTACAGQTPRRGSPQRTRSSRRRTTRASARMYRCRTTLKWRLPRRRPGRRTG